MLSKASLKVAFFDSSKMCIRDRFDTVHNYISTSKGTHMLRKGAVSAGKGEDILIPVNMKELSLIHIC